MYLYNIYTPGLPKVTPVEMPTSPATFSVRHGLTVAKRGQT
jgi:hypothetical protein